MSSMAYRYMSSSEIEVVVVDKWNIDDIVELYRSVNWWKTDSDNSIIPRLIKNSYVFAVAKYKKTNKAIGMGRVLSDGISDAYIQDVVVLEKWRNKGVGKDIIQTLLRFCLVNRIEWIALISEPHQEGFYIPLGFQVMKEYIPMKYIVKK